MRIDPRRRSDGRGGRTTRPLVTLALAALLVLGLTPVAQGAAPTAPAGVPPETSGSTATVPAATDACAPVSNDTSRPDPESDTLGWENGCWHDEDLAIDQRDGLNDTELAAVVARTMARVESIRKLEFEKRVEVEIITREEFSTRVQQEFGAETDHDRLRKNVKWEAMMMVGEDENAVETRRSAIGFARAYYSPTNERIVVVTADGTAPKLSEPTLGHELVHALQVQHFDVADRFDLATFEQRRTTDSQNAINSLLEGDAQFVQVQYLDRCDGEWDCLPDPPARNGGQDDPNAGMQIMSLYPYVDGLTFVRRLHDDGGWDAVDAAYANPPTTTRQVMYPDRYPNGEPTTVDFTDRSGTEWYVPEVETGQPEYVSVGEPGLTSMMLYTDLDGNNTKSPVVSLQDIINTTSGNVSTFDPYVFENNFYASGLEADRLYPYVTDRSAETGETGYVWKLRFESTKDGKEFVEGYTKVLKYHGATAVEGRKDTYRISGESRFADAYYVERQGDTVYVVNAPSVGQLSEIRAGAAPRTGGLLATLPFADEPTWVLVTIAGLLIAILGVGGRLALVLYRGSTDETPEG